MDPVALNLNQYQTGPVRQARTCIGLSNWGNRMARSAVFAGVAAIVALASATAHAQADPAAAEKLLKRNDCFKCHAIDKDKRAPAYKKVAARLWARSYGVDYVIKHLTTGPTVRLEDGTEEQHKVIDTQDRAELENLARWLLALK